MANNGPRNMNLAYLMRFEKLRKHLDDEVAQSLRAKKQLPVRVRQPTKTRKLKTEVD